eukprot:UN10973
MYIYAIQLCNFFAGRMLLSITLILLHYSFTFLQIINLSLMLSLIHLLFLIVDYITLLYLQVIDLLLVTVDLFLIIV